MGLKKYVGFKFYSFLRNRSRKKNIQKYSRFDLSLLKERKTSDTIFIFGSSPSINEISQTEWHHIKKSDSLGINCFLFCPELVPTFYWYEFAGKYVLDLFKFEQLDLLEESYSSVPCLINYANFSSKRMRWEGLPYFIRTNHQMIHFRELMEYNEGKLRQEYKRIYNENQLGKINYNSLIHARGSVATCTLIAGLLGYKNIVLPGVDLKSHDYFFYHSNNPLAKEYKAFIDRINTREQWFPKGEVHRTIQTKLTEKWNMPPIDRILQLIEDEVLSKSGGKIYAYSEKSHLSRTFPVFDMNALDTAGN